MENLFFCAVYGDCYTLIVDSLWNADSSFSKTLSYRHERYSSIFVLICVKCVCLMCIKTVLTSCDRLYQESVKSKHNFV